MKNTGYTDSVNYSIFTRLLYLCHFVPAGITQQFLSNYQPQSHCTMHSMKKFLLLFLIQATGFLTVRADEGMWLPYYINKIIGNMNSYGCKLTADQIYSMNQSSVKDAIVQFGTFCTGELVSEKGLIFTNHHCGYDMIAQLSSEQDNYLRNGFWASSFEQEIPAPGLTASILVYMQDVTDRVKNATDQKSEIDKIKKEVEGNTHYKAKVESMFYGSEYYLMVYEVFRDIRFVGAPPTDIGSYGGDTDNWMWPRHTGDFSIFRIYAGPDNKPADYSTQNKPYKPKHFLPISMKGVKPNDFVMVMGFPGRTARYLPVSGVLNTTQNDYPDKIQILDQRLSIMEADMDKDEKVHLALAGDYGSYANSSKYFKGVIRGIGNSACFQTKGKQQEEFTKWVNADPNRKAKYGNALANLEQLYKDGAARVKYNNYVNYAYFSTQLAQFGTGFHELYTSMQSKEVTKEMLQPMLDEIKAGADEHFSHLIVSTDREVMAAMLRMAHKNLPAEHHVGTFSRKEFLKMKPKGNKDVYDLYAEYMYKNSMLADRAKLDAFLAKPDKKVLESDPGIQFAEDLIALYTQNMMAGALAEEQKKQNLQLFVEGMREFRSDKFFYPDANFTLRLTYGQVKPYAPKDGISYDYYTTHRGILEKEIPGDKEFNVPQKLHDLLVQKDFGRYGENGELRVCFISNLDITGGNSGSPVINGNGELVGIAFDGVWEGMVGDLYWDPAYNRTIAVDVRYVLFIIDKFAGAQRLVDELKIVS